MEINTEPRIVLSHEMGSFLQTVDGREVDGVLVEILQHVCYEEDGDDSVIDLSQNAFDLFRVGVEVFGIFVELVIIISMLGSYR